MPERTGDLTPARGRVEIGSFEIEAPEPPDDEGTSGVREPRRPLGGPPLLAAEIEAPRE